MLTADAMMAVGILLNFSVFLLTLCRVRSQSAKQNSSLFQDQKFKLKNLKNHIFNTKHITSEQVYLFYCKFILNKFKLFEFELGEMKSGKVCMFLAAANPECFLLFE